MLSLFNKCRLYNLIKSVKKLLSMHILKLFKCGYLFHTGLEVIQTYEAKYVTNLYEVQSPLRQWGAALFALKCRRAGCRNVAVCPTPETRHIAEIVRILQHFIFWNLPGCRAAYVCLVNVVRELRLVTELHLTVEAVVVSRVPVLRMGFERHFIVKLLRAIAT